MKDHHTSNDKVGCSERINDTTYALEQTNNKIHEDDVDIELPRKLSDNLSFKGESSKPVPQKLSGKHAANPEHHLKINHEKEYNAMQPQNPTSKRKREHSPSKEIVKEPSCSSDGRFEILEIDEFLMKNSIKITLSQQDVIHACAEIVIVDGRHFCALEDSGFKKLLNPICEQLGNNFAIN
ncbi:hypothetical protein CBL_20062 [Carabus blaptoides fortunei]